MTVTNMQGMKERKAAELGVESATLVLDAAKGGIAVLIARALLGPDAAQVAGFAAFLGHCYPVFLGFRGGKGVATLLGTLLALAWPLGRAACATWAVVAALFLLKDVFPDQRGFFVLAMAVEIWLFCWLAVDINLTSVHGLYRYRLAAA